MFRIFIIHQFSLNSCSNSGISEPVWPESVYNGSHRSIVVSFFFGFGFCLTVLSLQHVNLTQALDGNLLWSSLSRVSLSLNTVVVGEVDELEEDVGWLRTCLEGVIDVEEWELDEELHDKPGTTIGTKFSVLHCIRIPFLMRRGFSPLIHSWEYPFLSESFPSEKTAGVFSRTSKVKNISNSLT